jgi:hypothetical protein
MARRPFTLSGRDGIDITIAHRVSPGTSRFKCNASRILSTRIVLCGATRVDQIDEYGRAVQLAVFSSGDLRRIDHGLAIIPIPPWQKAPA